MADEKDDDFDSASDAAAETLTAKLSQIGKAVETPATGPDDKGAPGGAEGTTPARESAKADEPDGSEADEDGEDSDSDDDEEDDGDEGVTPQKAWSKYTSDEERAKALAEASKTVVRKSRELDEKEELLRAKDEEIARLKAGTPPRETPAKEETPAGEVQKAAEPKVDEGAPEKPAARESYDDWVTRINRTEDPNSLSEEDRQVFDRLATLKKGAADLTELITKHGQAEQQEAAIGGEISKLETLIQDCKDALAEDDLDDGARKRLDRHTASLANKRSELRDLQTSQARLETKIATVRQAHDHEIVRLDQDARVFHSDLGARDQQKARTKGLQTEWTRGLADAFAAHDAKMTTAKERKLSADERATVTEGLERALNTYLRDKGEAPADLAKWVKEQSAPFERAVRIRRESAGSVVRRASDLEPGAPSDSKIKSGKSAARREKERSFDDEHEAASTAFSRVLEKRLGAA